MDQKQKLALQLIHIKCIRTINLRNTQKDIISYLYDNQVLYGDDIDSIFSHNERGSQTNEFLFIIKRRGCPAYFHLRAALGLYYPEIQKKLDQKYESIGDTEESTECTYCFIVNHIIATDISHHLYKYGIISEIENKHIVDSKNCYKNNVCNILDILKHWPKENQAYAHQIFLKVLKKKYGYIRNKIYNSKIEEYTKCRCNMTQITFYFSPGKISLGSKAVLSKLGKFYSDFVLSREKFDGFEMLVTQRIKDEIDPDLISLAYRSLICYKIYYLKEGKGVEEMYIKIKEQIPNTHESSWHEALIESLLTLVKLQQREYGEAAKHLQKAKDITEHVKPGFVTGVVYFNEALYYWALFMERPTDSLHSDQYLSKMKKCFELSAESHHQEEIFDMSCIIPQVYAYMALCYLQVDIVLSQDVELPECRNNINTENLMHAENALNYIRRHHKEHMTRWTNMLYYRGRAQLCLQHNSEEGREGALHYFRGVNVLARKCNFRVEKERAQRWIQLLQRNEQQDTSGIPTVVLEM